MDSKELYQKKQNAINARRQLESHGGSYDSTSTACFALILLALAVSGAGFYFMIAAPGNPTEFVVYIAYIGGAIFLLFTVIAIVVRLMHRHSRKPLIKQKKNTFAEYAQAVQSTLKYNYGLIPSDDEDFRNRLLHSTFGDTDSVVLHMMSLDGQEKLNLTLGEFDEDSLVFTKHGIPYQPLPTMYAEPMPETVPVLQAEPKTEVITPVIEENISITELFKRAQMQ